MQYSIYKYISNGLLASILFLVFACNTQRSEISEILDLIQKHNIDTKNINEVYILSSEECMTCNKAFSDVIQSKFDKPKAVVVVLADPTRIDLSTFKNHKNVIFVGQAKKSQLNFLYKSKVLFLKNQKVQDSIVIDAHNLEKQLNRVRNG